jgi:hypothetical protein
MGPIATARAPPYLGFFNDFSLTHRILSLIILVTGRACACGRPGFARFAPIRRNVRAPSFLRYLFTVAVRIAFAPSSLVRVVSQSLLLLL